MPGRHIAAAAIALSGASCFNPTIGAIQCSESAPQCPPGLVCDFVAGVCGNSTGDPVADASVPSDSSEVDASDPDLTDRGLVVRYFIDEASSGRDPSALLDSSEPATSLAIDYGQMQFFTDDAGNRAIDWPGGGQADRATAAVLLGSELHSGLDGSTQITIELAVELGFAKSPNETSLVTLRGASGTVFALLNEDEDVLRLYLNQEEVAELANARLDERSIVHLVVNTELVDADDRVALYLDGALAKNDGADEPNRNARLEFVGVAPFVFTIGNDITAQQAPDAALGYVAVYNKALTALEVAAAAARLIAGDDG